MLVLPIMACVNAAIEGGDRDSWFLQVKMYFYKKITPYIIMKTCKTLGLLIIISLLTAPLSSFSQREAVWKEASPSSQAYHTYRLKSSVPPYGLTKVKALIAGIKADEDNFTEALSNKAYLGLSLREKFTYHMIHGEAYSQNCDATPPILNEDKKVFGNLPDAFNERSWSERQDNFLVSNRDTVMALIRESVIRSKRMGVNYKTAVVNVNGRELIPFLVSTYNTDQKDRDILTVLMLLMKKNEYKPFMTSASCIKLYGKNSDYGSSIDFNKANEALIINRATAFYHEFSKK